MFNHRHQIAIFLSRDAVQKYFESLDHEQDLNEIIYLALPFRRVIFRLYKKLGSFFLPLPQSMTTAACFQEPE